MKLLCASAGHPCPPAAASPNESPLCLWRRLSHHEERAFTSAEDRSGTEPSPGGSGQHSLCSLGEKQIHPESPAMPTAPWDARLWGIIRTYPSLQPPRKVGWGPTRREAQQRVLAWRDAHRAVPAILAALVSASAALKGTEQQQLLMREREEGKPEIKTPHWF